MKLSFGSGKRMGWGIADQALSSLTNLALGVVVARAVGTSAFGAFALVLAAYWLSLGISRSLASEPFVVRFSESGEEDRRWAIRLAGGTALAAGVVIGVVCLAAALALDGGIGPAFLALAVTMPGLLLQDFWRYAFFAQGRGSRAFANDLAWGVVLFGALGAAVAAHGSLPWLILAWGGSASAAALFGVAQTRVLPNPLNALRWLAEQRDLAPRYLGEFMTMNGASQLATYFIGAIAGLVAVGSLRGGQILLGPLNVLFMGMGLVIVPEGVRLLRRSANELARAGKALSLTLCSVALAWGLLLFALPEQVGSALLGDSWAGAREVVFPLACAMAGSGVMGGAFMGLRSLAAARRSLRVRLLVSPAVLAAGAVGAALGGALGAAVGFAAATWFGAAVSWRQFQLALSEHERAPSGPLEKAATRAPVKGAVGRA